MPIGVRLSIHAAAVIALLSMPIMAGAAEIASSVNTSSVSKSRQTPFGLYLSPADAYAAVSKDPSIVLIDVRDPVEISFVGHPEPMDANIPLRTVSGKFDPGAGRYEMKQNTGFVADIDALMKRLGLSKSDPVIVTCRSGPRSAEAARLLHAAGYTTVWNQIEGFEGSIDRKTGARSKNGWRNAGLPWKYKISRGAQWQSTTTSEIASGRCPGSTANQC